VPIYVYECVKNGHQFEVEQRMTDEPLTKCEVCGGKVERLLFAPAIHFKGSGFHNTDYGTRSANKAKQAADAASKESGSGDSGSSDSGSSPAGGSSGSSDSGSGGGKADTKTAKSAPSSD
jgi:putative FmdB family regulatory protein